MYELKKIEEYLGMKNKNNRLILMLNGCETFRSSNFGTTVNKTNLWCLEKYND